MRWYTAVGVKMDQPGGSFCVQVGAEKKNFIRYGNLYLECITLVICGRNTNL